VAQRGDVDEKVDLFFDRRNAAVPVLKSGSSDGVYKFGQRIMRVSMQGERLIAFSGTQTFRNGLPLAEFVAKYENVEARKIDALRAAGPVISFLGVASGR